MKMLNKSIHTIMFALIFIVSLVVISFLFQSLGQLFHHHDPYKMPRGHAVKVFQQQGELSPQSLTMLERLTVFYLYGEN